jgi:uncharacterized protein
MTMIPPRKHMALAIDGGGAKGLIVAQALTSLEEALGVKALIDDPSLKILTGTSTGAIIAAGICVGMAAKDLVELYVKGGSKVFPTLAPRWLPGWLRSFLDTMRGVFSNSLYSDKAMKQMLRDYIERYTGNPDFTLGELHKRLKPGQALVITVVDLLDRRTRFIKSYQEEDADWKLWEVVLASSSAPAILPPLQRKGAYYADGGTGSFGNPAYIAAREAIDWSKYKTEDVTLFSFGTGWLDAATFEKAVGKPSSWRLIDWAHNVPNVMIADAARQQSIDIVDDYMRNEATAMDFRRFQIRLDNDFEAFAPTDEGNKGMIEVGKKLGQRVINNQHAFGDDPNYDPEGIRALLLRYRESKAKGGAPNADVPQQG